MISWSNLGWFNKRACRKVGAFFAAGLLLGLSAASIAQAKEKVTPPEGIERISVNVQVTGIQRRAIIWRKEDAPAGPTLVLLHDIKQTPDSFLKLTQLSRLLDEGWNLVAPVSGDGFWNVGRRGRSGLLLKKADDAGFLKNLPAKLVSEGYALPSRFALLGMGEGGLMVQRQLCETPSLYNAAGIVLATVQSDYYCNDFTPVPVVVMLATDDPMVPYYGGVVPKKFRTGGGDPGVASSASRAITLLQRRNECFGRTEYRSPYVKGETGLVQRTYTGCKAPLIEYVMDGAGHQWPGLEDVSSDDIAEFGKVADKPDASVVLAEFFRAMDIRARIGQ